jgi:uncharacterized protein (TIGR02268 family)
MEKNGPGLAKVGTVLTRRILFLLPMLGGLATHAAPPTPRRMSRRSLYLSLEPSEGAPEILVWARTLTTLRFESPVDAHRTKLEGGEALFEPLLIGGRSISLFPLRELAPGDRFRLTVALGSGEVLPFTLRSDREQVDGQVDVFPDPESCEALRQQWREIQEEDQRLRAERRRHAQEELSVDHALATLLVTGSVALTRFKEGKKRRIREPGLEGEAQCYVEPDRAAVLLTVTNLDPRFSWMVSEIRLVHEVTRQPKPFALRMQCTALAPGETGRIALVTASALAGTLQPYLLEIFKDDGFRHVALHQLML